jgi:hypothetical protein
MIEILKRIDAQIAECSSELSYLRSQKEEGGGFSPEMNELFERLSQIPINGNILDWNVINEVCMAFFGEDDYNAYSVFTQHGYIRLNKTVVAFGGKHAECTECCIGFYQYGGKFGNKESRLPQMSFSENGGHIQEEFHNIYELMVLLCQYFLEESEHKVDFIKLVKGLNPPSSQAVEEVHKPANPP